MIDDADFRTVPLSVNDMERIRRAVEALDHRLCGPLIPRRRQHHGRASSPRDALDVIQVGPYEPAQRTLRNLIEVLFQRRRNAYDWGQTLLTC